MSSAHESIQGNGKVERLLASLAGIVSAHVVRGREGHIAEIHILSSPDLHPKQVVRNVESALSAGLGIEIDRRVVSVAQIRTAVGTGEGSVTAAVGRGDSPRNGHAGPALVAGPGAGGGPGVGAEANGHAASTERSGVAEGEAGGRRRRLEYVRFESSRSGGRCTLTVRLRDGATEVTGEGQGPDTAAGRAETAARAVLCAVAAARPGLRLELQGAVISSSRGRSFVIVAAHVVEARETTSLAGAAPLGRSPEEAAILAALQATNRWSA